jgi:hypothetical protein
MGVFSKKSCWDLLPVFMNILQACVQAQIEGNVQVCDLWRARRRWQWCRARPRSSGLRPRVAKPVVRTKHNASWGSKTDLLHHVCSFYEAKTGRFSMYLSNGLLLSKCEEINEITTPLPM